MPRKYALSFEYQKREHKDPFAHTAECAAITQRKEAASFVSYEHSMENRQRKHFPQYRNSQKQAVLSRFKVN